MRKTPVMLREASPLLLLLGLSSCTLVTGAGEYEVDPVREQQEIDEDLMSRVRDLDYTLFKMSDNHPGLPLDVAVVDQDHVMQARARIMLAPQPAGADSVAEVLHLDQALVVGPQELYFYVDGAQNYKVDGSMSQIVDHIWIKPVNPDGTGEFTHSTVFQFFNEEAFSTIGGDVILKFPEPSAGAMLSEVQRRCLSKQVDELFDETSEVKIYLADEERQVGLFKTYEGGTLPSDNQIKLVGLLDSGSDYLIQVVLDGNVARDVSATAPEGGNVMLAPMDWLPVTFDLLACFRLP
jgi:hypothetical protein